MSDKFLLSVKCNCCGQTEYVNLRLADYSKWKNEGCSADAVETIFPYLTDGKKYVLQTGTCQKCLNNIFMD